MNLFVNIWSCAKGTDASPKSSTSMVVFNSSGVKHLFDVREIVFHNQAVEDPNSSAPKFVDLFLPIQKWKILTIFLGFSN
jgi:hypothetical protein